MQPIEIDAKDGHIPGDDDALWSFLIGDMIVFVMFFCIYAAHRAAAVELYRASQATLHVAYGVGNTLLLLTSSLFVAGAAAAFRRRALGPCRQLLGWGVLCGLGFAIAKCLEYYGKAEAGITPLSNEFFTFYYVFTGIHLVHLLVGVGVLGYGYVKLRVSGLEAMTLQEIESGASYWHMVDLLWIVIFPLIYLLP